MIHATKLRRAAVLFLLPALIACSKSSSTTTSATGGGTTAAPAGGDTADAYVQALCSSMNDWVGAIQTRAAQVGPDVQAADTLTKRRDLAVAYFGDLADITGELVDTIKAEGPPDVDGGEASHAVFVSAFTSAQQIFVAAQTTAKSLSVTDAKAFKTQFNSSLDALKNASDQIGTALSSLTSGDLDAAAASDPACQTIGQ